MLCSASVNALQIVFSNSLHESTAKWETNSFSKRTNFWCAFSSNICNQNGHFMRGMQSSILQSYDDIHIMGELHQLRGVSG